MASEEYQEQPKANQPSSTPEEAESFTPQEAIEQPDKIEPSQTTDNVDEAKTKQKPKTVSVDENKNWWDVIIDKIRSILPESVNNSLSDWVLTGIISGLIVLILSISVILLPSRASTPGANPPKSSYAPQKVLAMASVSKAEIAEDSAPITTKEETKTSPQSVEIPSIPKPEIEIEIEITEEPTPAIEKEATKPVTQPVEITSTNLEKEISETKVSPQKNENSTTKTPPAPKPVLTPEQSLFSVVQDKVSKITSQYSNQLIVSGEADLLGGRLLIKVSDDWYQLDKSRQDKFANETLKSSQKFNFNKLEIQDAQNNLIARSPVVGNKMIILQRKN